MEPENGQEKNIKLKKASVNILLSAVKFLLFLKKVIGLILGLLIKFIYWILRSTLKKPLVKIYYWIFRFRKEGLIENSVFDIVRKKLPHFVISLLVIVSFIINFGQPNKISAVTENMAKTTVAQLVSGEFSNLEQDEMIEETLNPSSIYGYTNEKYENNLGVLNNDSTVTDEQTTESEDQFVMERNGDFVSKPYIWESRDGGSSTNQTPKRKNVIYYTVQSGETISSIANSFGLNVNTILWANNLSERSLIRPGDKLTILPQNGVMYTVVKGDTVGKIARKYGIGENLLISENNLGNSIAIGQKIIIPGGRLITNTSVASQTSKTNNYTGISVIKDLVKAPANKVSGGSMLWPTVGHRITQYYSWRHTGLDVANKVGTPLYAAAAGKVEFAGWSNGYGYNVVINHGGGKKTRYAHASKLFVKVGQSVDRGENIAAMGSTGWSTGPHIHFEVIVNGVKYNPLNYVK